MNTEEQIEKKNGYQRKWKNKNKEKVRKYQSEYYQKNKEKYREYARRYQAEHKEEIAEKNRIWRQNNKDKLHKKYIENKDKIYAQQKEYIKRNRKKVTKMVDDYRKRKAEEFKAQGQMYCYLPKTERQTKMIEKLAKSKNIDIETSKKLLIDNDWNIKKLLKEYCE